MWEGWFAGVVRWFAKDAKVLGIVNERVVDTKDASSVIANAAVVRAAVGGHRARTRRA